MDMHSFIKLFLVEQMSPIIEQTTTLKSSVDNFQSDHDPDTAIDTAK